MGALKRNVAFIAIGVCVGLAIWFGFLRPVATISESKTVQRPFLTELPKIKSCVEHVKLVRAELVNRGDSQVAVLELENQAYVGVTSISVELLFKKGKDSIVSSGFSPDKPPLTVIEPGQRKTITIGNLDPKSIIRIAGVMFSDGTEEGCEPSLKEMRQTKDRDIRRGGPQK